MTSLFISHSSEDRALADEVAERLAGAGYGAVFLDTDPTLGIPVGGRWERELYAALRRSDGVVFVGTAAATASRWCFAELAIARSLGTQIFAISFDGPREAALLSDLQWVDGAQDDAYVRLVDGLRRAGLDPRQSFAWDETRSPFPGLRAFGPEDAAVFFGRRQEVMRLNELLHPTLSRGAGRWVSIIGPSGSGKSSLLFAGLLPGIARLSQNWVIVPPFVPGAHPTRHLADSLSQALDAEAQPRTAAELEGQLTPDDAGVATLIDTVQELSGNGRPGGRSVLVSIDQAEELITRTGRVEQQAFLRLLDGALHERSPLWVVCTLRSEFLSTDPERAGLTEVTDDAVVVEPLSKNRISEVIAQPARRAGLDFDPGLVERMVEETSGGDALPLLAYTLSELTKVAGPLIRHADYDALGGVVGAMRRRADQLKAELEARGLGDYVRPTLLRLVRVDQDGEPIRRRLQIRELTPNERRVIDAFVEARLLTSTGSDGSVDGVVEVAHEALLRQWSPLRQWIEESRASIQTRTELEREAADWDREGRDESYLLRGGRLLAIQDWVARTQPDLSDLEKRLLEASGQLAAQEIEQVKRSNRRLRQLLVGAAALLLIAVTSGVLAAWQASEARRRAAEANVQSNLALTRQLLTESAGVRARQPDLGVLLAVEAVRIAPPALRDDAVVELRQTMNRPFHVATQLVQGDVVNAVSFSQNGSLLASAANDRTVQLWDTATGAKVGTLAGHTDGVHGVAFSPQDAEGTRLASASNDGTIRLWDTTTGSTVGEPLMQIEGTVGDVAYNRDGSQLAATTEGGTLQLWDVTTGKRRPRPLIEGPHALWRVTWSPDGSLLAVASADGTARLVDVSSGRPREPALVGHQDWVNGIAFHPSGATLASAGTDGTVRLWDVATGKQIGEPLTSGAGALNDVVFSPRGDLMAWGGRNGAVVVWDVKDRHVVGGPLLGHGNAIRDLAFSPDGRRLASASYDGTVRLWEVRARYPGYPSFGMHVGRVNDLAFSPAEPLLASVGQDGKVVLWDVAQRRTRNEIPVGVWISGVAFSPDGRWLAAASADRTIRVWDVHSGRPRGQPLVGHADEVSSVAFNADGRMLASGGRDGAVRLWDAATGAPLQVLTGHEGTVTDVAYGPGTNTLTSVGQDGTVRLWDTDTGQPRGRPMKGHAGWILAVATGLENGTVVSAGGDGTVRIWKDGALLRPLTAHSDEVNGVAVRPDGQVAASVGRDGALLLWDSSSGRQLGEALTRQEGELTAVAFARSGFMTATASSNGEIQITSFDAGETLADACGIVNRNLTRAEWDRYVGAMRPYRTCTGR